MFEDSTFESTGRIKTRSRRWMIAAFTLNGSVLGALILIPLIYPDALPRHFIPALLVAPGAPAEQTPQAREPVHAFHGTPQMIDGHFFAPRQIPTIISMVGGPEDVAPGGNFQGMDTGPAVPGADGIFHGSRPIPVVHPDVKGPVRVSSMVVDGLLIRKTIPQYPPIPRTMGIQGTVVLQATISKLGTIENLHVVSGPVLLQQAAMDAVKTWQYRPYLLNQQPVEVETTVNVVFTIAR
jgi:protein TonB